MQTPQTPTIETLTPERLKAITDALDHVRLTSERMAVVENILTDPRIRIVTPDGEPDDLSVAVAGIEQALTCLAIAFEELEQARFAP